MKKIYLILSLTFFLFSSVQGNSQLGKLKNKVNTVKNKTLKQNDNTEPKNKENTKTEEQDDSNLNQQKKDDVKKSPIAKDVETDGITGEVHKNNINKIVFSNNQIIKGEENTTEFLSSFNLGDELHFRVYMDNSLSNYTQKMLPNTSRGILDVHSKYKFVFYLNDEKIYESGISESSFSGDAKRNWTTWRGAFSTKENRTFIGTYQFKKFVLACGDKLTSGTHKLKVEIAPYLNYPDTYTGEIIASGELNMIVGDNFIDSNDPNVCLPKAEMKDKALESKIIEAFKKKGWKEQPKEARITSDRWIIVRNEYSGIPIKRYLDAVVGSTKDGKCIYQEFSFSQDYDGNNYQSTLYLDGIGSQYDIHCNCLK